jgi:hypothetical protein
MGTKRETKASPGSGEYFTAVKSMECGLCLIAEQASQVAKCNKLRTVLLGGACRVDVPRGLSIVASLRSCVIPRALAIVIICIIGAVQRI